MKILLNIPKGLSRNGGFSSKKGPFSAANISKKKADFGPRPEAREFLMKDYENYCYFTMMNVNYN